MRTRLPSVDRRALVWAWVAAIAVRVVLFLAVDHSLAAAGLGRHITVTQAYVITYAHGVVSWGVSALVGWFVYRRLTRPERLEA